MNLPPKRHVLNRLVLLAFGASLLIGLPKHFANERAAATKLAQLRGYQALQAQQGAPVSLKPLKRIDYPPPPIWQDKNALETAPDDTLQTEFAAGEEDDPTERDRWFWEQRAFPKDSIPVEAYQGAVKAELADQLAGRLMPQAEQWTPLGPAPLKDITYGGDSAQNTSGRATTVVIHPTNPQIVFIGAAQGGIWKSTNGAASFASVSESILPSLAIKVIRFAPSDPRIMYAGTGEPHGSTGIYGMGVLKSTDGGESWQGLPRKGSGWDFEYNYVSGLRVDPTNPNTVYVTTAFIQSSVHFLNGPRTPQTGIYKSTDGGASWTLLKQATLYSHPFAGNDLGFMDLELGNANLLYATEYGGGIYKSSDAGANWLLVTPKHNNGPGRFPAPVNDFTYFNEPLFFLLKRLPLETSLQGGSALPDFSRIELGLSKSNPLVLYAGYAVDVMLLDTNNNNSFDNQDVIAKVGLLFKSTDGGQTWRWLGDWGRGGAPDYCANQCSYDNLVEVNPADENDVIIGGSANYNGLWPDPVGLSPTRLLKLPWRGMIHRSQNGGQSWNDLTPHCTTISPTSAGKFPGTNLDVYPCSAVDTSLVIHPDQHGAAFDPSGRIYISNDGGLYRATTGEIQPQPTSTPTGQAGQATATPTGQPDQATATAQPTTSPGRNSIFLPVVISGGARLAADSSTPRAAAIQPATIPAAGLRWENLNNGLDTMQFYAFDAHPTNPDIILGGLQDNANAYFNGQFWDGWGFGDGTFGLFDPKDPKHVYMGTQFNVHRHDAGGAKIALDPMLEGGANGWKLSIFTNASVATGESVAFRPVFAIDPVESNIVYGASDKGLYRSVNRGDEQRSAQDQKWPAVGTRKLAANEGRPTLLSVSPKDHNTVYMATSAGYLFRFNVATGEATRLGDTLPGRYMTQVTASPLDANTVYVTLSGYNVNTPNEPGKVFKSTNRGQSWTNLSGDLPDVPVSTLALDPENPNRLWVGSDIGVFVSENGDSNWRSYRNNMPIVTIMDLKYNATTRFLMAATHGRGMWRIAQGAPDPNQPTSTPVPTTQPGSTATTRPTIAPTATGTAQSGGTSQLLQNQGFENPSLSPWQIFYGSPNLDGIVRHSGSQSLHFGGEDYANDEVVQQVTIPSNATGVSFTYWLRTQTNDAAPSGDQICGYLYDANTTKYYSICTNFVATGTRDWHQITGTLSAAQVSEIRGQTVFMFFDLSNDPSLPSQAWVDDTALNITTGGQIAISDSTVTSSFNGLPGKAAGLHAQPRVQRYQP